MGNSLLRQLHYWAGSLKLRLALASFVLIAASVAFTVVFVLRDMEGRSQRAVLGSESANAERYAALLSARLVGLQTSLLILSSRARTDDTVARIGGDEFAVILRGCDRASAERVAHDLCERVRGCELERAGAHLSVGASIGVVEIDVRFETVAEVMAAADAACYEAKRAGRNAVRTYQGNSTQGADDSLRNTTPI